MRRGILGAVGLLALLALAGVVEAQSVPATPVVITVGGIGSDYGYDGGSYGTLVSGAFPGDLFGDGNSRAVASIYEDSDAVWHFVYSGGTEARGVRHGDVEHAGTCSSSPVDDAGMADSP